MYFGLNVIESNIVCSNANEEYETNHCCAVVVAVVVGDGGGAIISRKTLEWKTASHYKNVQFCDINFVG